MCGQPAMEEKSLLVQALGHLQAAIDLLDRAGAPGQIAAHVDLARHQLSDAIEREPKETFSNREESRAPLAY
jgi:hypothetical protein